MATSPDIFKILPVLIFGAACVAMGVLGFKKRNDPYRGDSRWVPKPALMVGVAVIFIMGVYMIGTAIWWVSRG